MKLEFKVDVLNYEEIHELPNGWTSQELKEILELTEFRDLDEIDDEELKGYTIMALQDMEADEAAEIVLKSKLLGRLSTGQIQNLSHEMLDEKLWEEYTDINLHAELFNCSVMLKRAFPNQFPETEAVKCRLEVEGTKKGSLPISTKSFLVRLLAGGMDGHALLNRLFKEQISKTSFPEAEGIVWCFDEQVNGNKKTISVFSSEYWLHDMKDVGDYISEAFSD